jgi:hypothetical protein
MIPLPTNPTCDDLPAEGEDVHDETVQIGHEKLIRPQWPSDSFFQPPVALR